MDLLTEVYNLVRKNKEEITKIPDDLYHRVSTRLYELKGFSEDSEQGKEFIALMKLFRQLHSRRIKEIVLMAFENSEFNNELHDFSNFTDSEKELFNSCCEALEQNSINQILSVQPSNSP